jgi:hypothetical protein
MEVQAHKNVAQQESSNGVNQLTARSQMGAQVRQNFSFQKNKSFLMVAKKQCIENT